MVVEDQQLEIHGEGEGLHFQGYKGSKVRRDDGRGTMIQGGVSRMESTADILQFYQNLQGAASD